MSTVTIPVDLEIPLAALGNVYVTPQQFGATGDGVTDDHAAIVAARDYCLTFNPPRTLAFPEGDYVISQTLNLTHHRFHVLALGGNCRFIHTGTGVAVSFNGYAHSPTSFSFVQTFGGAFPFIIKGNPNTTIGLYTNNVHHSRFKADIRDCQIGWKADKTGGGPGAGVLSHYDIRISQIAETPFNPVPTHGADLQDLYACKVSVLIEACGKNHNWSVKLINSNGNQFDCGTVESGIHGGMYIAGSNRNTFTSVHNEVNGTIEDWYCGGNHNTYMGIAGAGKNTVVGAFNSFIGCDLSNLRNEAGAVHNIYQTCKLPGFVNADTSNTVRLLGCEHVTNNI